MGDSPFSPLNVTDHHQLASYSTSLGAGARSVGRSTSAVRTLARYPAAYWRTKIEGDEATVASYETTLLFDFPERVKK